MFYNLFYLDSCIQCIFSNLLTSSFLHYTLDFTVGSVAFDNRSLHNYSPACAHKPRQTCRCCDQLLAVISVLYFSASFHYFIFGFCAAMNTDENTTDDEYDIPDEPPTPPSLSALLPIP